MIETFTHDTFSGLVNSKFRAVDQSSNPLELELIKATDLNSTASHVQFSLLFLGPIDGPVQQGLFNVEHEKLGTFELFLVPIAKDKEGVQYEAVFNRFVS